MIVFYSAPQYSSRIDILCGLRTPPWGLGVGGVCDTKTWVTEVTVRAFIVDAWEIQLHNYKCINSHYLCSDSETNLHNFPLICTSGTGGYVRTRQRY